MRALRTPALIVHSLIATACFYAGLALLMGWNEDLRHALAGAGGSSIDVFGGALRRGFRDIATVAVIGLFLFGVYAVAARAWGRRPVAARAPGAGQAAREWFFMMNALIAGSAIAALVGVLRQAGHTRIYSDIASRGWGYAILSGILFVLVADTWSYWWHRAFHASPLLYGRAHRVHHLSVRTTVWSAYQGSPYELIPSVVFWTLMAVTVPLAAPVLAVLSVGTTLYLLMSHGGIELFPRGTARHPLGRWIVTPTYHQMHHELVDRNFGLYFTWWDVAGRTRSAAYEARFDKVTGPAPSFEPAPQPEHITAKV